MDHEEILQRLANQEQKIDAIYTSVEKTRKYFAAIFWITVILFVLPLIGFLFAIPSFINTYSSLEGII